MFYLPSSPDHHIAKQGDTKKEFNISPIVEGSWLVTKSSSKENGNSPIQFLSGNVKERLNLDANQF